MTSVEIQHHFYDILSLKVQFLLIVFTLICFVEESKDKKMTEL